MMPLLVGAWSTYKVIRIHSFHHTHTPQSVISKNMHQNSIPIIQYKTVPIFISNFSDNRVCCFLKCQYIFLQKEFYIHSK